MAKKKPSRKRTATKAAREQSGRKRTPEGDSADGVRVGEEPVPGVRLRAICRGHEGTIGRIAWSPCGRFIASPSKDKTIRIWDANDGQCLQIIPIQEGSFCLAWVPDGSALLASGTGRVFRFQTDRQHKGRIVRPKQFEQILSLAHADVYTISFSADGTRIVTASSDHSNDWEYDTEAIFEVWDSSSLLRIACFDGHNAACSFAAWSPDGNWLATSQANSEVNATVWNADTHTKRATLEPAFFVLGEVSWSPDGKHLAGPDMTRVCIFDAATGGRKRELEGHVSMVLGVCYAKDYPLLVSVSESDVCLWDTLNWSLITQFGTSKGSPWAPVVAFTPDSQSLVTLGQDDNTLAIWTLDLPRLFEAGRSGQTVRYSSAKVVLVGKSNVGKSCLAMRLAEDRYPEDHEHGTTHGMRFWSMEAEELHTSAKPPEGQRRDVVLWDFGGQDEYQLVHQMFLHDTTLALVLIDPTRGRSALDESRDWNRRLEKHLGKDRAVKLLVGAKVDRKRNLIDQNSIEALCKECGFAAFIDLSAKTGRNTKRLRKLVSDALDWDQMAKTSRPELFQRIRDEIERQRGTGEVVVLTGELIESLSDLSTEIEVEDSTWNAINYGTSTTPVYVRISDSVGAVTDQLATQGTVVKTQIMTGDEALVLQLPIVERYAGSLIVAARNNPRGVPVLEERLLGSTKTIPLPGMTKKERLSPAKERMVLECIVELMIQHGICFRHGGLLVFPTLFPAGGGDAELLPHSVSLYYDFTGAIDNIYASLVSRLMVSEEFGEGRLLAGRVEFDRPGQGVCGIRQTRQSGGLAHVDLFFSETTTEERRDLFVGFVDRHLADNGVDITEHRAIKCLCGEEIAERIVHANIARGEKDVVCPVCRMTTLISEGVAGIRERDPQAEQKILALRKTIEERTARDAAIVKSHIARDTTLPAGEPIRVLHLSDLHFTRDTSPQRHLVPLVQDIRNGEFLGFESVEYLVISGDMTDKGGDAGFDKAREFVEALIEELGLSAQRCILLPGNHDVQDVKDAHQEIEPAGGGKKVQVRHPENYRNRFVSFSKSFYHKVVQQPYPLDFADQGISYLFPDRGIQFFALNSAWQVDRYGRDNSGIHPDAVAGVIQQADRQIEQARQSGDLKKKQPVLRLAAWHHALEGKWAIQNDEFLENLQAANVKLCLHGDVHESRRKLVNWWDKGGVHILGAGTFGAPEEGRPESTPRLYNLLEIQPDLRSMRIHTREQRKAEGTWKGWYEWPDPDGGNGKVPFFDVDFATSKS